MGKKTKAVNNRQSGGIDFIRAKKKVGRTIKKANNETDTTVKAKRINLSTQQLGADDEAGAKVTTRGLSINELMNQTTHYSARVRKEALDGVKELLCAHPDVLSTTAATVIEKVAERLVDLEAPVRSAARGALRAGVLPALGPGGLAPFARRLVLHLGAALTHVAPSVRRDAPAVLDALLDVAPELVAAHAPAATLRHLAELLRRGDDAASSSLVSGGGGGDGGGRDPSVAGGLSAKFGDMTASRVGAQAPAARLHLLGSCRRFLEVLVGAHRDTSSAGVGPRGVGPSNATRGGGIVRETTWHWGDVASRGGRPRRQGIEGFTFGEGAGLALHAHRARRAGAAAKAGAAASAFVFGGGERRGGASAVGGSERSASDGREGVPHAAAELAALLFSAWDEAAPTLEDTGGMDVVKVRAMTEALTGVQLSLRLVDAGAEADAEASGGGGHSSLNSLKTTATAAALQALAGRVLRVFPAVAPAAAGGGPERRALVALNVTTCRLLAASSAAWEATRTRVASNAATRVDAAVASYLAAALRGTALDAGPCGAPEPTAAEDHAPLLEMARGVLARGVPTALGTGADPGAEGSDADDDDDEAEHALEARRDLVDAVGWVWSRAVTEGPPEVRAACVALLAATLPAAAEVRPTPGGDRGAGEEKGLPREAAAAWLRPFSRLLWELKHGDPGTTSEALRTLRAVAARTSSSDAAGEDEEKRSGTDRPGVDPLIATLRGVESELAPFFARVPPPPPDPEAPRGAAKPGPFSRLPANTREAAVALLGSLPTLSPATLRAVAHAVLAPGSDPALAVRAVEATACNLGAAPLALSVSFLATLLTGAPDWSTARQVAPAAGRVLCGIGDAGGNPWAGASLAWPAASAARRRAAAAGDEGAARRAAFGWLVASAVAAESAAAAAAGAEPIRADHPSIPSGTDSAEPADRSARAPEALERELPEMIARALTSEGVAAALTAAGSAERAAALDLREDQSGGEGEEEEGSSAAASVAAVCARLLLAAPRWTPLVLGALARAATSAAAEAVNRSAGAADAAAPKGKNKKRKAAEGVDAEATDWSSARDVEAAAEAVGAVCSALPAAALLVADEEVRGAVEAFAAAADVLVGSSAPGAAGAAKAARVAKLAADAVLGEQKGA